MDPLRLMLFNSASLGLRKSGFAGSAGVGASEDSGVRLKARRGRGRRIRSSDMIAFRVVHSCDCDGKIEQVQGETLFKTRLSSTA